MSKICLNIVWFKRDLRIHDHLPLLSALEAEGETLLVYCLEPKLWQQPDMSGRHFDFLSQCVNSLSDEISSIGGYLTLLVGSVENTFKRIMQTYPGKTITLYSHEETWNNWTYQRDLAVKAFCDAQAIIWKEFPNNGVVRRLKTRDNWTKIWDKRMHSTLHPTPTQISTLNMVSDAWPKADDLSIKSDPCTIQKGGRQAAVQTLKSFLSQRGQSYSGGISSPLSAINACSRLSTYIAFGMLSIKEIYHALHNRIEEIKNTPENNQANKYWLRSLRAFEGRLHWHCHFIQKLEDEPRIEYENLHPAYDNLRSRELNESYLKAWKTG